MTQFGEYIKMAMKNIWANKVRTLLTMLGIIIGISSVILIISVGNGATELITSELGQLGKGQIVFYVNDYQDKYAITQEQIAYIRDMDGVKAAATQMMYEGTTKTKKDEFKLDLIGLDADGFTLIDSEFAKGRAFTEKEAQEGKNVCVISEDDAMKFFGSTDVVGLDLEISVNMYDGAQHDITATIIGVTKSEESSQIAAMFGDPTAQVIVPPQIFTSSLGVDYAEDIYQFYVAKEDQADGQTVCDEIIEYLETSHHCKGKEVYRFNSFDDQMKTVNQVINLITVFVAFVASVSLLVGGIGVMNIMLVSVTERTREIGIRKALGAKTGSITVQFLAESAFITLLGGLIGILCGVIGANIVAAVIGMMVPAMKFSPALKLGTILIASFFSSAVGIFFGIYPARKAAKLSPIEALRRD